MNASVPRTPDGQILPAQDALIDLLNEVTAYPVMQLREGHILQAPDHAASRDGNLPFVLNGANKRKRVSDNKQESCLGEDGSHVWNPQNILGRLFHHDSISMPPLKHQKTVPDVTLDTRSGIALIEFIVDSARVGIEPECIWLIPFG